MSLEEDILIERFLRNKLSEKERNNFLDKIKTDPDVREKFLLEKQLFETLNEEEWSYASKIDTTEVEEYTTLYRDNADRLKQVIQKATTNHKRKGKIRRLTFFSAIAAAALFAILINFYPQNDSYTIDEIYANYNTEKLPSLVTRNSKEVQKDLSLAERNFKNKNYKEALLHIDTLLELDPENSTLYIYKAISHIETGEFAKSEASLDTLIHSDLIDAEKGYWYKSLLYLKAKDLEKCKQMLQIIIENSYFNSLKANKLLKDLATYEE
ncbi:tetratricopeptide repeat protein [Aquimarina litoralis]|uniref:tetratricopeptide repeat protein n=1 Tax=Aquimarina litoralis TaxID=584605 RepID=UPI001C56B181|nr:tetratricopeptide repeat protein [Aquimarina litoralis]MBW1298444.1 hypothetical protein [Aquimarina litoralis]